MIHTLDIRVFYEDTDMAGIVYYANYLRYIERGRSSMLRECGVSQNALREDEGTVFAVTEVTAKYLKPAILDDLLTVETRVSTQSRVKIVFEQTVLRGETRLFTAMVSVACMSLEGRPRRVPPAASEIFTKFQA